MQTSSSPDLALVRELSSNLEECELTHQEREPIDANLAREQHDGYIAALESRGVEVITLPPLEGFPDAVFVEDCAVVLDEVAVLTRPGAESRRGEVESIAEALAGYRNLERIESPATLEGGDVLTVGDTLYVGWSGRTNHAGLKRLAHLVVEHGYAVKAIEVEGCLHLKSAVTRLDDERLLVNPSWLNLERVRGLELISVHPSEPLGANVLAFGKTLVCSASYPRTNELLSGLGFEVVEVEMGELHKMESAVTCSSLLFRRERGST